MDDKVLKPSHYTSSKYEPVLVLQDWFPAEPLLWQVGKYIARWDKKGDPLSDLQKAAFYLDMKIRELQGLPIIERKQDE